MKPRNPLRVSRLSAIGLAAVLAAVAALPTAARGDDETVSDGAAMRWWNTLNAEQMVAALHGDVATPEQAAAAKMMYADLDEATRALVDAAAAEIYGDGHYYSVGQWWETLDCRKMRVAAGDGNAPDPMSPYCAHYPGSGAAKILEPAEIEFVNVVGQALLGRMDPGVYPSPHLVAMRWWNALNGPQMVAALYGDAATPEQAAAAKMMYMDLDSYTRGRVDVAAAALYGAGHHRSVGDWWETLDCRKMRIAAGDGNTHDPASLYCRHYPGSVFPAAKILGAEQKAFVDKVGQALLKREDPGVFPPRVPRARYWWNALNGPQMVAALYGDMATPEQEAAAKKMYMDLDDGTRGLVNHATAAIYGAGGYGSAGAWWESLDCRKMRIAAGDGNTHDPASLYCRHYPGSGFPEAKILGRMQKAFVDKVGQALLGREKPGVYPPVKAPVFTTSATCAYGVCRVRTGQEVTFRDLSGEGVMAMSRKWRIEGRMHGKPSDMPGGRPSGEATATHSWSKPGYYRVALAATMRNGEMATASRTFLVEPAEPEGLCVTTAGTRCLQDGRYAVRSRLWWSEDGKHGAGRVAPAGTNGSGLFQFHGRDNWEILVKVLDGCSVNGSDWVFAASATDLGYLLEVTDTVTGMRRQYRNEPGHAAAAVADTGAFPGACGGARAASVAAGGEEPVGGATGLDWTFPGVGVVSESEHGPSKFPACRPGPTSMCLRKGRYEITVDWSSSSKDSGKARVARAGTPDSGLFWFFEPDNWEMLVKVLDGCKFNGRHWVFAASATDLGFELTVRDRTTNAMKRYTKAPGAPAMAVADTGAFVSCG